jgi:surface antigen
MEVPRPEEKTAMDRTPGAARGPLPGRRTARCLVTSALMLAAIGFPATSAAAAAQSLAPAIERLTSQAAARGSAELVVDARDYRFCALSLSQGRHVSRALVRVSQPHVRWTWRVARDASPGRWSVAIACARSRSGVSSSRAGRALGGLSIAGGHGRGRLVAPHSLRISFSPAAPAGRAPSSRAGSEAGLAAASNPFDFGQCTYHAYETRADVYEVAVARGVPRGRTPSGGWWWDAWHWLGNARTAGIPTGSAPRAGALVVFPRGYGGSSIGHVAYVVRVSRGGSYVISERNWNHDQAITTRLIVPGYAGVGFIYGGPVK